MTDAVQIELIRAIPMVLASASGTLAAWFSYRAAMHSKQAVDVAKQVQENTNGLTHQLNTLTAKASHAEGVLDEKNRAEAESTYVEPAPPDARTR
jgi:hypothetical protein